MKILIISNFYPPVRAWGYTQWCHDVSEGLRQLGHQVHILTSRHQSSSVGENGLAQRELYLENDINYYSPRHFFLNWAREDEANKRITRDAITRLDPDVVFIWGMYALSRSIPAAAEALRPGCVTYYISDHWPASETLHESYWKLPARRALGRLAKPLLGLLANRRLRSKGYPPKLRLRNCMIVSEAVRSNLILSGAVSDDAIVVHGGSDARRYYVSNEFNPGETIDRPMRLLYAGFLGEHKGVHTAIEAMSILANGRISRRFVLSVAGTGHPAYERYLESLTRSLELTSHVQFLGRIEPGHMQEVFTHHEVLVFPSIYDEPFARVIQEAMLAGLVVVGTETGGSGEILVDGATGLVFEEGNAVDLARKIERLAVEPDLAQTLAREAQTQVLERFTLDRMVADIESYLLDVAKYATVR